MKFKNLSIIGGGPNAVYALELLLKSIIKKNIKSKKTIKVFEQSGLFGCGKTHSKNLDNKILLNRVAGQISLGSYPFEKFPQKLRKYDYNFMEWKNQNKLKIIKNLKSSDWPPRKVFGLAMEQKFFDLIKIFKNKTNVQIELHYEKIISIKKKGRAFILGSNKNDRFLSDAILVVTGNYTSSVNCSKLSRNIHQKTINTDCKYEYNFLDRLDSSDYWKKISNKNILIFGTGVSSLDIITLLKNRRNKIYPISRSFLFPFARPLNQKLSNPKKFEHKPVLLKKDIIEYMKLTLNARKNFNKINFENFIMPLIKIEFYLIYFKEFLKDSDYNFLVRSSKELFLNKKFKNEINNKKKEKYINDILINFIEERSFKNSFFKNNWFSQKKFLDNIVKKKNCFFDFFSNPLALSKSNFKNEYLNFLLWDISEAKKGNLKSSFKKACDGLWRDLRPQITTLFDNCVNFKTYKYFLFNILSIHNRLCDGPSLRVIQELRKYIKKDFIKLDFKSGHELSKKNNSLIVSNKNKKVKIDYIFLAIASIYKNSFDKDVLIKSMIKNKLLSFNCSAINKKDFLGLNLNIDQHPIIKKDKVLKNITFIGPASEGSKFFHHTLSRPDKKQFNLLDLEKWVKTL